MNTNQCRLCGSRSIELIHNGTRDNPDINVLKCTKCGLVFLSDFEQIHNGYYENSKMRPNFNRKREWNESVLNDNLRRVNTLSDIIQDKDILDFGCGEGCFLELSREKSRSVSGIELDRAVRETLNEDGYTVWESFDQCNKKFDLITMFHVIEHLEFPIKILDQCREHLNENGKIIIETPNADDALLSLYQSNAFADFTYWGAHLFLYNEMNLINLVQKAGFKVSWSKQVQRYPIANHLYWLAQGKPGGQAVYTLFNDKILNEHYYRILSENKLCDTLMICIEE